LSLLGNSLDRAGAEEWQLRHELSAAATLKKKFSLPERFREEFSHSRYIPNVLYVQGMALDTRVDVTRFRKEAYIDYYHDFPSHVSYDTWAAVLSNFPQSPVATVATVHMAKLLVRDSRVDEAIEALQRVARPAGQDSSSPPRPAGQRPGWREMLDKKPAEATLNIPLRAVVGEGRRLLDLLVNNRDTRYGDAPLADLFALDPRSTHYASNLEDLLGRYPGSALEDNLLLASALTPRSAATRIARLRELLLDARLNDARPAAIYDLARVLEEDYQPAEAQKLYRQVMEAHPLSPWADDAKAAVERLTQMAARR